MTTKPTPQPGAGGRAGMKKELPERFKSYKHVWVFVELERGVVHPVSWELMGEGRKLADKLGVQLAGVVLGGPGEETREAVAEAFAHGADVAYLVESPVLADYRNEPYTRCMTELVNTYQPEILLLGATTLGRDLAGAVATTLMTGLTADCTELGGRRGRLAGRNAPDLRRQPSLHDLHPEFPPANGDRASARVLTAGAAGWTERPCY